MNVAGIEPAHNFVDGALLLLVEHVRGRREVRFERLFLGRDGLLPHLHLALPRQRSTTARETPASLSNCTSGSGPRSSSESARRAPGRRRAAPLSGRRVRVRRAATHATIFCVRATRRCATSRTAICPRRSRRAAAASPPGSLRIRRFGHRLRPTSHSSQQRHLGDFRLAAARLSERNFSQIARTPASVICHSRETRISTAGGSMVRNVSPTGAK